MLEAMALGSFVVCPDVIGNRAYVLDGHNAFRPNFDEEQILAAAAAAPSRATTTSVRCSRTQLRRCATTTCRPSARAFLPILHDAERLWAEDD